MSYSFGKSVMLTDENIRRITELAESKDFSFSEALNFLIERVKEESE